MFCCSFHFSFSHVTQRRVALHFTPLFELIYLSVLPINAWGVWAYPYFSLETTLPVSWLASDCAAAAGRQRFYMKCEKCRERVARKVVVVAVVAWSQRTKQNKTKYNSTTTKAPNRPDRRSQQRSAEQTLSHTPALAAAYNADDWGALSRDQTTRWRRDVNTLELAVGWGWQSDDDADADVGLWAAASTTCVRLTGWPNCGAPWENPKIIVAHVEALG